MMSVELTEKQLKIRRKLLDSIEEPIEPVRAPMQYKLALLLATFVMVLLPVIYVAIACGFAGVVYYHAVYSVAIFSHVRGRGAILALIIYLAPLVAGITAVLFMFKPLFSRALERDQPTSLNRSREPILFDFVDKLCDSVHAPRPKRIDVDCQVNASASFRRGWISMLLGNDLVLTIGLPLIAGMTLRQVSGILAHEFGHFSQGGGMRLTYIIRTVSHWFTRVVYERDTWDQNLERWSKEHDIRIGIIFYLARGCVWLTRRVLWVLMMIGHAVSGLLLRQMEFDADRHEVRFSGSQEIEPLTRRLHELMVANQMANSDLALAFREGRLADDVTSLVSHNADNLPDDVEKHIDQQISEGSTGWLDTHPSDRERIESGLNEEAPGVFHLKAPAKALFVKFGDVSRRATKNMYESVLGNEFRPQQLRPAKEVIAASEAHKQSAEALDSFCQSGWTPLQKFPIPDSGIPVDLVDRAKATVALEKLRQKILKLKTQQASIVKRIATADEELGDCVRARLLLDAEFKVPDDTFSRKLTDLRLINRATESINVEWSTAEAEYSKNIDAVQRRLWVALRLLRDPSIQSVLPDADDWLLRCDGRLIPAFQCLMSRFDDVMHFCNESQRFVTCLTLLQGGSESEGLFRETRSSMEEASTNVRTLRKSFGDTPYPFEHLDPKMTIAKYLCEKRPNRENPVEINDAISEISEKYFSLYHRILARLCEMAVAVEKSLGLEPLPTPVDEEPPEIA